MRNVHRHPASRGEALPEQLRALADEICVDLGEYLTQQYHPAEHIYYLLSGGIEFFIQLNINGENLSVGTSKQPGTIVGWSGLRSPNRFATTIRATGKCKLLRWKQTEIQAFFRQQPDIAIDFLEGVLETGFDLLQQVRLLLSKSIKRPISKLNTAYPSYKKRFQLDHDMVARWLQASDFFQKFSAPSQGILLDNMFLQRCYSDESVITANEEDDTLYILVNGSVNLYYETCAGNNDNQAIFLRSLSSQGLVLNVLSIRHGYRHGLTVLATHDSLFCCLSMQDLRECALQNPQFGLELQYALLTLLGNQLRSSRAQFINQKYDDEVFNITGILAQAAPQLSVISSLHKVPHLLGNRLTHGDAFRCLEMSQARGAALEKNLAGLCLDILQETRSEWKFYQGLKQVYQSVAEFPEETDPQEVRRHNAALFRDTFEHVRYRIEGQQHLPEKPGHIFILNHLVSHPYHILPNHFELSLDTNFVSAMILDTKYGDSGIRVVRKERHDEYAHHNYHSRLGYIDVITEQSHPSTEAQTGKQQLERFIDEAKSHLQQGRNIVICPEGKSLWSDESPGIFKPGAFLLAASLQPEPYIVPIAMANFDKRLRNTQLAAVIKPAFRITELVDTSDKQALKAFLMQYQSVYRSYVKEAQQLAMTD